MPRLTDRLVRATEPGDTGLRFVWDDAVSGLGLRVTKGGAKSFVLRYVLSGRERMYTLARYPDLSTSAAREIAIDLRGRIARGEDPLAVRENTRKAPTVRELAADYLTQHAERTKRAGSVRDDRSMIDNIILPALGGLKVADVTHDDVAKLHASLKATPYRANRVLALISKMMNLAVQPWRLRPDNPAKGVIRFPEDKRDTWLSTDELRRLCEALDAVPSQRAANAIRLLMLTGARRGEVLKAEWKHIDFARERWTKPSAHTKQKTEEHVPLSAPALALLAAMKAEAVPGVPFVFPGDGDGKPLQDIRKTWLAACAKAGLEGVRLHDLRHTYASHLVSSGLSLEIVGRLLGHTQVATTKRYAHLADSPLREATERFGALVGGRGTAEVVPLERGRKA
ncbi:MAG: site-specific integrase [Rhodospirillales bacterium]|jgi:integrase|nr:site-specific integrase [Rhodospirillales bacterium]